MQGNLLKRLQGDWNKSQSFPTSSPPHQCLLSEREVVTGWLRNDNDCWWVHCWALIRFFLAFEQIKKKKKPKKPIGCLERQDWPVSVSTGVSQDTPRLPFFSRKFRPFTEVTWNEVSKDLAHQAMSCSHDPICQKSLSWKTTVQQSLVNTYLWRPGDTEVFMSNY